MGRRDVTNYGGALQAARVDRYVGERIRRRRTMLGYTQEQLAEALQISYQQIQKYETGANRISAGRLHQIGQRLGVPVAYFFEGLELDRGGPAEVEAPSDRVAAELMRRFSSIEDESVRGAVLSLVKSLTDRSGETPKLSNGRGRSNGSSEGEGEEGGHA